MASRDRLSLESISLREGHSTTLAPASCEHNFASILPLPSLLSCRTLTADKMNPEIRECCCISSGPNHSSISGHNRLLAFLSSLDSLFRMFFSYDLTQWHNCSSKHQAYQDAHSSSSLGSSRSLLFRSAANASLSSTASVCWSATVQQAKTSITTTTTSYYPPSTTSTLHRHLYIFCLLLFIIFTLFSFSGLKGKKNLFFILFWCGNLGIVIQISVMVIAVVFFYQ